MSKKIRIHNEWFQPIVKSVCPCGRNKKDRIAEGLDPSVYAWGEYVYGRWSKVDHFCQGCFKERVIPRIMAHADGCGCVFSFNARSTHSIPSWITPPTECAASAA